MQTYFRPHSWLSLLRLAAQVSWALCPQHPRAAHRDTRPAEPCCEDASWCPGSSWISWYPSRAAGAPWQILLGQQLRSLIPVLCLSGGSQMLTEGYFHPESIMLHHSQSILHNHSWGIWNSILLNEVWEFFALSRCPPACLLWLKKSTGSIFNAFCPALLVKHTWL